MAQQEKLTEIMKLLDDINVKVIVLKGDHGCGKTWLARELHDAVQKAKRFRHTIWLPLAKESNFDDLCEMIHHQINLQPTLEEEQKEDDLKNVSKEYYEEEKKNHLSSVKQKITEVFQSRVSNAAADIQNPELTLIFLDNVRDEHVESVINKIKKLVDEKHQFVLKFLMTSDPSFQGAVVHGKLEFIELTKAGKPLYTIIENTRRSILEHYPPKGNQTEETEPSGNDSSVEVPNDNEEMNCYWHFRHLFNKHGSIHCNELIAHWMMEGYLGPIHSVKKAYQKGHKRLMRMMMRKGGFHILQQMESNTKVALRMGATIPEHTDPRHRGYLGSTCVGLVDVFEDGELHMLEGIVPVDGMIRTLRRDRADGRCLSLFLAENYLNRRVLNCFGKSLKCLAYFNPRSLLLPLLLDKVTNLSVLILRGCDFIPELVAPISKLELLTVLEISGKGSVECLPDKFFSKLVKLRTLNLSGLPIKSLPKSFSELVDLQWLILKGCYRLSNLPSVKKMVRLEMIDLRGASCLPKMGAQMLKTPLQLLDLSHTRFKNTPKLQDPVLLTRMLLRGCSNLRFLSSAHNLQNLQVLDVSGANQMRELSLKNKKELISLDLSGTALREVPSEFDTLEKLEDLNLSRTEIKDFRSMSKLTSLRKLTFQDYVSLTTFPEIKCLTQLEELDFSGCNMVKVLPDMVDLQKLKALNLSDCESLEFPTDNNSLSTLSALLSLDLSGTKFAAASTLSSLTNLEKLSLRGLELDSLDGFTSLTKLKELYLNDLSLLKDSSWDFLGHLELDLRILNLSSTTIKSLPSLSKLSSSHGIEQLILADCSFLEDVPDLKALTKLQVLDLSNTGVKSELFADAPESLRKLSIKDCGRVEGLFPLKANSKLELLDLRRTNIRGFSGRMDEMTNMKSLWLSEKTEIRVIPRNRNDGSSEVLFWDQYNLSKPSEVRVKGCEKPSMFAIGNHSFHVHDGTALLWDWEAYCKQLHFKCSSVVEGQLSMIECFCRDDFVFNNSKSWESRFPKVKLQGKSLEIHGCSSYPEGSESSLQRADKVAVIGSSFISSFSDLRLQDARATKVGYFSHCANMKCAFKGKNMDGRSVKFPESLVLSDLVSLESIFIDVDDCIESLKNVCIDCCPKLQTAFNGSQKLVNLESVQIKFCEKLESVFEKGDSAQASSLQNVIHLNLFGLPELREVGANLRTLQTLRIGQCPRIENLNKIFPSLDLTENLRVLQITSCDGLVSLFGSDESSSPVLRCLRILQLTNLPRLRTIYGQFPCLESPEVDDCPVLETKKLTELPWFLNSC